MFFDRLRAAEERARVAELALSQALSDLESMRYILCWL